MLDGLMAAARAADRAATAPVQACVDALGRLGVHLSSVIRDAVPLTHSGLTVSAVFLWMAGDFVMMTVYACVFAALLPYEARLWKKRRADASAEKTPAFDSWMEIQASKRRSTFLPLRLVVLACGAWLLAAGASTSDAASLPLLAALYFRFHAEACRPSPAGRRGT